ncbi:MAG: peptidylprolyl isomerase [Elusimicrobiota bacterium]
MSKHPNLRALCLAVLLSASPLAAKLMEDTVAVVNGTPILLSEYQKEVGTAMDYWGKTNPAAMADPANVRKLRESTLEQLIDRELLTQEGGKLKIKVREREIDNAADEIKTRFKKDERGAAVSDAEAEASFQKQLKNEGLDWGKFRERLSRQILSRKTIDEVVKAKMVPPTEDEARAYFAKVEAYIASKSTEPPKGMEEEDAMALREVAGQVVALSSERVHVYRILVRLSSVPTESEKKRALKTARDIKKRLDGGADFGTVAKEESEDPESAAREGDLGYVVRGVAPPELEKVVFSLPVGETSEPILTDMGYNIVKVTEKRAAEKPNFERFKDELTNFLAGAEFQKKVEAFVKGLRDKATIERNLPSTL